MQVDLYRLIWTDLKNLIIYWRKKKWWRLFKWIHTNVNQKPISVFDLWFAQKDDRQHSDGRSSRSCNISLKLIGVSKKVEKRKTRWENVWISRIYSNQKENYEVKVSTWYNTNSLLKISFLHWLIVILWTFGKANSKRTAVQHLSRKDTLDYVLSPIWIHIYCFISRKYNFSFVR